MAFNKEKYHDAIDELARQIAEMAKEEYPDLSYDEIVAKHMSYYLTDAYSHLDDAIDTEMQPD